jgi:hypothetical protein
MSGYLCFVLVSVVTNELDAHDLFARNFLEGGLAQKLSRLSGEHCAHNQLDSTSLVNCL